jgi:hypothetical protein
MLPNHLYSSPGRPPATLSSRLGPRCRQALDCGGSTRFECTTLPEIAPSSPIIARIHAGHACRSLQSMSIRSAMSETVRGLRGFFRQPSPSAQFLGVLAPLRDTSSALSILAPQLRLCASLPPVACSLALPPGPELSQGALGVWLRLRCPKSSAAFIRRCPQRP